ncbi:hypothetical protein AAC387_Pa03g1319 [Persea americana]
MWNDNGILSSLVHWKFSDTIQGGTCVSSVEFAVLVDVEGVDFDVGVTLLCTQSNMVSSPCIWDSRKVNDLVTERFRSRWFGGWTAKGSGKATKSIPKLFTRSRAIKAHITELAKSRKTKELETKIRKHGGTILFDVPTPSLCSRRNTESRCKYQQLPIVLSPKKVQTTKFLYGCAINTLLLKSSWLTDSILAGYKSPPGKYLILSNQATNTERIRIGRAVPCNSYYILDKVGIMFYGKPSFCSKLGKIVKHGCGQVVKTLQWLVQSLKSGKNSIGAVVVEDEGRVSRHLRQFSSEQRLQMMLSGVFLFSHPASWIRNSFHSGKVLPFKDGQSAPLHSNTMPELPAAVDMSEEI